LFSDTRFTVGQPDHFPEYLLAGQSLRARFDLVRLLATRFDATAFIVGEGW